MNSAFSALRSTENWAIPILDRSKIPDLFQDLYAHHFQPDDAPYLLYNPQQNRQLSILDEKLICLSPDRLVILAPGQTAFSCKLDEVVFFSFEELLLAYSIQLFTDREDVRIDYNAACSDLFEPILARLRVRGTAVKDGQAEWQQLSRLAEQDLKFTNYARQILRDSGPLVDYVYQTEIVHGDTIKTPAGLLILTETELCWVRNEYQEWTSEPIYGGVLSFTARDQIVDCQQITLDDEGQIQLIVTLKGNHVWKIPFARPLKDHLAAIRHRILA